jgi:hypothetical protein
LKQLLLHIGLPKTGTSALQTFLANNQEELVKSGILYDHFEAGNYGVAHYNFVRILLSDFEKKCDHEHDLSNTRQFFSQMVQSMDQKQCQKSIISVETLGQLGPDLLFTHIKYDQHKTYEFEKFSIETISKIAFEFNLEVKVVFYARRQDYRIESWYNQMLKDGYEKLIKKKTNILSYFEEWKDWFDLYKLYEKWAAVFGKENIIIRVYEAQQLDGDIINDFFTHILQYSDHKDWNVPLKTINSENTRLGRDVLEYKRIIDKIDHPNSDRTMTHNMHQVSESMRNRDAYVPFLSPQESKTILKYYEASNQKLADIYFKDKGGELFLEQLPRDEGKYTPYEGLSINKSIEISERLRALEYSQMQASLVEYKAEQDAKYNYLMNELQSVTSKMESLIQENIRLAERMTGFEHRVASKSLSMRVKNKIKHLFLK